MRVVLLLAAFIFSTSAMAGGSRMDIYSVDSIVYDVTHSLNVGDVIFCGNLDSEHGLLASNCVNLNIMQNHRITANSAGVISAINLQTNQSVEVGQVIPTARKFLLDDMDHAELSKAVFNNTKAQLKVNILAKNVLVYNDKIGCTGIGDCDWSLLYRKQKLTLEVKLNEQTLEKVKLN